MKNPRLTLIAVTFALLLAAASVLAGGINPIGLSWDLDAARTVKAKGLETDQADGVMSLFFGPIAAQNLQENELLLIDDLGDALYGTWLLDDKGRVDISFSDAQLQDYVTLKVQDLLPVGMDVTDVTIQKDKSKAAAKSQTVALAVKFVLAIKAEVEAADQVDVYDYKTTIKIKGAGETVTDMSDYYWDGPTASKATIKGVGSVKEEGQVEIIFGPDNIFGLADNEFLAMDDEFNEFTGTFALDNGSIEFFLDEAPFVDFLEATATEYLEEEFFTVENVQITNPHISADGKIKPAESLKLKLKSDFDISGTVDGINEESTGSYKMKMTGEPFPW